MNFDHLEIALQQLDTLKEKVDAQRPLNKDQNDRLWQKLRLDWNYHSNSIEGNTLSMNETRSFILHGITAKGKPYRDYVEMDGHNKVLKKLDKIIVKENMITESLIKDLHEQILVEPYQDENAEINPGKYKELPNHLYSHTGERIDFLPPGEVIEELNKLVNWTNNHIDVPKRKRKKYDLHPVIVAAAFQVRFIEIHPFGDGNGRLSRILGNLILMQCGYTPAIIKLENRQEYYAALNSSSLDDPTALVELLIDEVTKTLELTYNVATGSSIDDVDDVDKKLALLEMRLKDLKVEDTAPEKTTAILRHKVLRDLFKPLCYQIDNFAVKVRDLFGKTTFVLGATGTSYEQEYLMDEDPIFSKLSEKMTDSTQEINLKVVFHDFKKADRFPFSIGLYLRLNLSRNYFEIFAKNGGHSIKTMRYDHQISEENLAQILRHVKEDYLRQMEQQLDTLNKRLNEQ
jgi:Fic family protein